MATKMCFKVNENKVFDEEIVTFTYVKGMAFRNGFRVPNCWKFRPSPITRWV